MPEITMKFELPEEKSEFTLAFQAPEMYNCLWDIESLLRNYEKYNSFNWSEEQLAVVDVIRKEFYSILATYSFDINCVS